MYSTIDEYFLVLSMTRHVIEVTHIITYAIESTIPEVCGVHENDEYYYIEYFMGI